MAGIDVAVVGFARHATDADERSEQEMLLPVIREALAPSGLDPQDMGFVVSGSSDYLAGQPFSFVAALDAVGPWPPLAESHVEMDGAFALYEAWLRLQHGDIDTALVYAFGKSSGGDIARVLAMQLDPYTLAPLFPDAHSLAALQARLLLESGGATESDFAQVVARSLRDGAHNASAQRSGEPSVDDLLAAERTYDPLRDHDCPPVTDGCAAVVLATADRARALVDTPVWIRGIDQRAEAHAFGVRDLAHSESTRTAAAVAGVDGGPVDVAEIHAPWSSQELIVRHALGVNGQTLINPSGGALVSNPVMVAGLDRIGWAATQLQQGQGRRAVAHATSGPLLQQNLVCVLEVS
jgi:acetyl-CoA acetyltransferase